MDKKQAQTGIRPSCSKCGPRQVTILQRVHFMTHNKANPFPDKFGNSVSTNNLFIQQMERACPNGIDHCICANNVNQSTSGPFFYNEDPLGVVLTYQVCNPGTCFCKDDPSTPIDTRPEGMRAVMDVCPPGEMNRCLCHDNTKVQFPFDYRTFYLDCRPKRVRWREQIYSL